ncbi:unnamed protein product [Heligmosomoides polygyrus]|uniref:HTH psq-type domain-containing protein n=1 Tax=Heligmosomoides polygyrus TaxID=6339 RepID=A0A3P8CHX1_HELPZ|nr:unnamed protein product [Heligmosomoides polygyrus]
MTPTVLEVLRRMKLISTDHDPAQKSEEESAATADEQVPGITAVCERIDEHMNEVASLLENQLDQLSTQTSEEGHRVPVESNHFIRAIEDASADLMARWDAAKRHLLNSKKMKTRASSSVPLLFAGFGPVEFLGSNHYDVRVLEDYPFDGIHDFLGLESDTSPDGGVANAMRDLRVGANGRELNRRDHEFIANAARAAFGRSLRAPDSRRTSTRAYPHREAARLAESGEFTSAMARKLGIPLRTVQRIVKQRKEKGNVSIKSIVNNELGLRSYRLPNGQQLTEAAKENRYKKCKELPRLFSRHRVEDVLWIDDRIFTMSHTML